MNMKSKSSLLAAITGLALMTEGLTMDRPLASIAASFKGKLNGHSPWNTVKSTKVKKWRKRERLAKKARKINWM